jgi:hypothetical protein
MIFQMKFRLLSAMSMSSLMIFMQLSHFSCINIFASLLEHFEATTHFLIYKWLS